jgi:hypothetical protein
VVGEVGEGWAPGVALSEMRRVRMEGRVGWGGVNSARYYAESTSRKEDWRSQRRAESGAKVSAQPRRATKEAKACLKDPVCASLVCISHSNI